MTSPALQETGENSASLAKKPSISVPSPPSTSFSSSALGSSASSAHLLFHRLGNLHHRERPGHYAASGQNPIHGHNHHPRLLHARGAERRYFAPPSFLPPPPLGRRTAESPPAPAPSPLRWMSSSSTNPPRTSLRRPSKSSQISCVPSKNRENAC